VYRTTLLSSLYRETALPPIEIALDSHAEASAVRLHRLDNQHPLTRRLKHSKTTTQTRFQRLAARVPSNTEWTDPLTLPPWEPHECHETALLKVGYQKDLPKDQAAQAFRKWLTKIQPRDIIVYSDRSQQSANNTTSTGAGWVITQVGRVITRGRQSLGPYMEVYDAEAKAASLQPPDTPPTTSLTTAK